jgi:hypothetical protein
MAASMASLLNFRLAGGVRTTGNPASAAAPVRVIINPAVASIVVCMKFLRLIIRSG